MCVKGMFYQDGKVVTFSISIAFSSSPEAHAMVIQHVPYEILLT